MVLHADQQTPEHGRQGQGSQRDRSDGDGGPEDGGMPLPHPKLANESHGMFAGGVEEIVCRHGHWRGVEDAAADANKGDDEDQLERVDDVIAKLRSGYVEAKDEGHGEAEDRGGTKNRIDADEETDGDAPG